MNNTPNGQANQNRYEQYIKRSNQTDMNSAQKLNRACNQKLEMEKKNEEKTNKQKNGSRPSVQSYVLNNPRLQRKYLWQLWIHYVFCPLCICNVYLSKLLDVVNVEPHSSHKYGLFSACFRLCRLKQPDLINVAPHSSHKNGLSPVCVRKCTSKWPDLPNAAPHSSHEKGLSQRPLCVDLQMTDFLERNATLFAHGQTVTGVFSL